VPARAGGWRAPGAAPGSYGRRRRVGICEDSRVRRSTCPSSAGCRFRKKLPRLTAARNSPTPFCGPRPGSAWTVPPPVLRCGRSLIRGEGTARSTGSTRSYIKLPEGTAGVRSLFEARAARIPRPPPHAFEVGGRNPSHRPRRILVAPAGHRRPRRFPAIEHVDLLERGARPPHASAPASSFVGGGLYRGRVSPEIFKRGSAPRSPSSSAPKGGSSTASTTTLRVRARAGELRHARHRDPLARHPCREHSRRPDHGLFRSSPRQAGILRRPRDVCDRGASPSTRPASASLKVRGRARRRGGGPRSTSGRAPSVPQTSYAVGGRPPDRLNPSRPVGEFAEGRGRSPRPSSNDNPDEDEPRRCPLGGVQPAADRPTVGPERDRGAPGNTARSERLPRPLPRPIERTRFFGAARSGTIGQGFVVRRPAPDRPSSAATCLGPGCARDHPGPWRSR